MGLTANPLMKINLGHQEVDRLIDELIAVYHSTPVEWLTVKPIAQYLCVDLGYEDEGEFEDALNGTFIEFLRALPNVELRKAPAPSGTANPDLGATKKKARTEEELFAAKDETPAAAEEEKVDGPFTVDPTHKQTAQAKEDAAAVPSKAENADISVTTVTDEDDEQAGQTSSDSEVWEFKIKPEPEQSEWKPKTMRLLIKERSQLWNVLLKSQYASIEIPHMEFEVSADGKRKIDTIYNHIGSAIFNLGTHIAGQGDKISEAHQEAYTDCILGLNRLLDVEHPWVMIVKDPSGLSDFTSMVDVEVLDA